MKPTTGSLFSGVAGFEQGFAAAGFKTLWQVEIDPQCREVLARHYPAVQRFTDIRQVDPLQLPRVDVITFGSPCQDMSVAGKRGGIGGERSGLFFEAIRIIAALQPDFAVWENVPGCRSSGAGADFLAILDALAEVGALDIAWRTLDAQFFGVPQRRERVFLVADFRAERAGQILLEPARWSRHPAAGGQAREREVVAYALAASARGSGDGHGNAWNSTYVVGCVAAHYGKGSDSEATDALIVASGVQASAGHHGHSSPRGDGSDNLVIEPIAFGYWASTPTAGNSAPTLRVGAEGAAVAVFGEVQATQPTYRGGLCPQTVRRLTPRECERLMSWPDDWTRWDSAGEEISDTHRYRMCGNGVVASVAAWIARRMMAALMTEMRSA